MLPDLRPPAIPDQPVDPLGQPTCHMLVSNLPRPAYHATLRTVEGLQKSPPGDIQWLIACLFE